jgi:hypothetical protein
MHQEQTAIWLSMTDEEWVFLKLLINERRPPYKAADQEPVTPSTRADPRYAGEALCRALNFLALQLRPWVTI